MILVEWDDGEQRRDEGKMEHKGGLKESPVIGGVRGQTTTWMMQNNGQVKKREIIMILLSSVKTESSRKTVVRHKIENRETELQQR